MSRLSNSRPAAPARCRLRAFTLIELIIVVTIIAILSAIAVPNFLEAQARSKISRAKSDLRALATGIEAYTVDWGQAPRGNFFQMSTRELELAQGDKGLILLSTPVAYLSQGLLIDIFQTVARNSSFVKSEPKDDPNPENIWYKYSARDADGTVGTAGAPDFDFSSVIVEWWVLQSSGPDLVRYTIGSHAIDPLAPHNFLSAIYDPTNGTMSRGSIYRVGGSPSGPGHFAFRMVRKANN